MASEEGVVIACHTKEEFDAQMAKAKEAGKLVRAPRASSSPILICRLLVMPPVFLFGGKLLRGFVARANG